MTGEAIAGTLGVVAIGRNEGARLERCLRSVIGAADRIVYVDSGSTDGSLDFARSLGVEVVELPMDRPFTMARARNAGFERLLELAPQLDRVQFVDGDCELQPGWLATASRRLDERPELAAVCGRRRERRPDASLYNRLVDLEWAGPTGEVEAFGGDVALRTAALREVGGYDASLIAGEDPELGLRLRRAGYGIERLRDEMTLHDAALTRFGQWWTRNVRAGHAYAESAWLHGGGPERYRVRQVASIVFWSAVLPVGILLAAANAPGALAGLLVYPVQAIRIDRTCRREHPAEYTPAYGAACVVAKWAQLRGIVQLLWNRLVRRRPSALIEYKQSAPDRGRS